MTTMRFIVEVSVAADGQVDQEGLADDILDYLCDGGDGIVDYPPAILSVDSVEPIRDR